MSPLNVLTKTYGYLRNYGMPKWVMTLPRKAVRRLANWYLPKYLSKPCVIKSSRAENVIVSFTSFPARIADVWKVVESLKRQNVQPEKIILWLSELQFPNHNSIPDSLWEREDEIFEIRMVKEDIRSHKKFYYVMQEFPDKAFVTCDDDIYYDPDMIKRLLKTSSIFPGCIIANISVRMRFDEQGVILPYLQWDRRPEPYAKDDCFQVGVGGVLYPPNTLHKLTLRKDLFMSLTPMADDIWLNSMARLNGTCVVQSEKRLLPLSIENNSPSLSSVNKGDNKNDLQLLKLREYLIKNDLSDVYSANYLKKHQ